MTLELELFFFEESAVDECPRAIYTLHFFDEIRAANL